MDDLVLWLGVQFDEDERIARAADTNLSKLTGWIEIEYPETKADEAHAMRHSPARVLRDIDGKRRTLIRCQEAMFAASPMLVHFARQTLREMALSFSDRPGYERAVAE